MAVSGDMGNQCRQKAIDGFRDFDNSGQDGWPQHCLRAVREPLLRNPGNGFAKRSFVPNFLACLAIQSISKESWCVSDGAAWDVDLRQDVPIDVAPVRIPRRHAGVQPVSSSRKLWDTGYLKAPA